jgi:hypothetical protein
MAIGLLESAGVLEHCLLNIRPFGGVIHGSNPCAVVVVNQVKSRIYDYDRQHAESCYRAYRWTVDRDPEILRRVEAQISANDDK